MVLSVLSVTFKGISKVFGMHVHLRAALKEAPHSPHMSSVYSSLRREQTQFGFAEEDYPGALSGSDSHGLKRQPAWQESSGLVASYPIVSEFGAQNMVAKMRWRRCHRLALTAFHVWPVHVAGRIPVDRGVALNQVRKQARQGKTKGRR